MAISSSFISHWSFDEWNMLWRHVNGEIIIGMLITLLTCLSGSNCLHCEQPFVFMSNPGPHSSLNRGYFTSPMWPDKYPENVRCRYRFVGQSNQRVRLTFHHFNVEGLADDCVKDFLDIYIEVTSQQSDWETNLSNREQLLGRYCGHQLISVPNTIISLGNIILLDFFSGATTQQSYNQDDHMGGLGFNGTYEFVSAAPYSVGEVISPSANSSQGSSNPLRHRSVLFSSADGPTREVLSPTYPGLHPPHLNYTYILQGRPGERVWLKFLDFDMHTTAVRNCPFDYVRFYDGSSTLSKPIQRRFCGSDSLSMFSTLESLTVEFITQPKDFYSNAKQASVTFSDLQRRGFKFMYTFSKDFIQVDLVDRKLRIPGTECDMWVKSAEESEGYLSTPGFPTQLLPPNKTCNIYFYGIHNKQTVELVELSFVKFDFPPKTESICKHGYVEQYSVSVSFDRTRGTERKLTIRSPPDRVLCGRELPKNDTSKNPVLLLKVNTTHAPPQGVKGFQVKYRFKKDFGIRGNMVTPGVCHFKYSSHDKSQLDQLDKATLKSLLSRSTNLSVERGFVNSPFYNRPYPNNMSCKYEFTVGPHEYVRLVFTDFRTKISSSESNSVCTEDYLSVTETLQDEKVGALQRHDTFTFCGANIPGPILSHKDATSLKLHFVSDNKDSAVGFQAVYEFIPRYRFPPCLSNVTFSSPKGGLIQSPNYPYSYPANLNCEWVLRTTGWKNSLVVHFTDFEIEGSPQSCSYAVVNIYEESNVKPSVQLCGTASGIPAYVFNTSIIVIRFLTAPSSRGIKGFRAVWTEVMPPNPNGKCNSFTCKHSRHCIDQNLECNGIHNCGTYLLKGVVQIDDTDETSNCPVPAAYSLLHVGGGILLTIVLLSALVVFILYRENRRSNKKLSDPLLDSQARKQLVSLDMLDLTYPPPPATGPGPRPTVHLHHGVVSPTFSMATEPHMEQHRLTSRQTQPNNQHQRHPLLSGPPPANGEGLRPLYSSNHLPPVHSGGGHELMTSSYGPPSVHSSDLPSQTHPSLARTAPPPVSNNNNAKYANSYHSSHMASLLDGGEATLTREKMQKISIV